MLLKRYTITYSTNFYPLSKDANLEYVFSIDNGQGRTSNSFLGVYTLAVPTFIISLFLDRLGVANKSAFCLLFVATCCFHSASDSWFAKVVLCVFWADF